MFELLLAIGIGLGFFVLAFFAGRFEKRSVRSFESAELPSLTPYMEVVVEQATSLGFVYRDSGIHVKYGEKWIGALLLSADACILAVVSQGNLYRLTSKKTVLMSRFSNDSVLITVDEAGTAELDPMTTRQIVMNASFSELLDKHLNRIQQISVPRQFPADADWSNLDELNLLRNDRIVARGLAVYLNPEKTAIRYTAWGSFRASIVHGIAQLLIPQNYWRHFKSRP